MSDTKEGMEAASNVRRLRRAPLRVPLDDVPRRSVSDVPAAPGEEAAVAVEVVNAGLATAPVPSEVTAGNPETTDGAAVSAPPARAVTAKASRSEEVDISDLDLQEDAEVPSRAPVVPPPAAIMARAAESAPAQASLGGAPSTIGAPSTAADAAEDALPVPEPCAQRDSLASKTDEHDMGAALPRNWNDSGEITLVEADIAEPSEPPEAEDDAEELHDGIELVSEPAIAPLTARVAEPPPTTPAAAPALAGGIEGRVSKPPPTPKGQASAPDVPAIKAGDTGEIPVEPKKRKKAWFEHFFNDDYLRTVRPPQPKHVTRQVDFIEQLLQLPKGGTILDVGCGLGLHAVELSARGYLVVGLDLSLPMLSRAADEAQDRGLRINFLHADMREMNFDGAFDAVLCWGTTFGYFDDETNKRVIARMHRALKPKGVLLIDVVNRDYVIRSQPNLVWFEGDGCVCMEETNHNSVNSRLQVKRTVILDDGRQHETLYSVRLYSLHEMGRLLHSQGFRVTSVTGNEAAPGVFFGADSPRLITLAERRAENGTGKFPVVDPPTAKTAELPPGSESQ